MAQKLGWPFSDTDSLLVSENGSSIKDIVKNRGWETFRKMEQAVVEHVCAMERRVVATGGGVVLDGKNVALMKKSGKLIWLRAEPHTIKKRMRRDTDSEDFRPALTTKDRAAEIEETLIERNPLYQQAMDFYVDTDERDTNEISNIIIRKLELQI